MGTKVPAYVASNPHVRAGYDNYDSYVSYFFNVYL